MFRFTPIVRNIRYARPARVQVVKPFFRSVTITKSSQTTRSTGADAVIEDITELFATAKDEFEIAMEETEKSSVYAESDREAAKEELVKLQTAYKKVVEGEDKALAEEVRGRIGHRIRELENGVQRMEEMAMEHD